MYKPRGMTSYDVIRVLKNKYPGRRIGHGGTLDPLAEGVLVVGVGREATRKLALILKNTKKEYEAEIELGKVSQTDDAEGVDVNFQHSITNDQLGHTPNLSEVREVLKDFVGEIQQVPPRFSAVKVGGVPAYKRARRGEKFRLNAKQVRVYEIKLLEYAYPVFRIRVTTGSGVYIRSLARDIGASLGVGAYLKHLVRTRVGEYTIKDSHEI